MPSDSSNDNTVSPRSETPDVHGQAALLLVESLVHGLIARDVITVADAVEIVDVAAEVQEDIRTDQGESPPQVRKSLDLLDAIRSSLRGDLAAE